MAEKDISPVASKEPGAAAKPALSDPAAATGPTAAAMPARAAKPRTIIYVDGFNLYYGAIDGGPHKWLNLEKFFRSIRPNDDVQRIYYFTALVHGEKRAGQETYLSALATLPLVSIVLGKYKTKSITCRIPACTHTGDRVIQTFEEKRTDVAIAIQMLQDAYEDACDSFIVVSGDSDLVPPVHAIKKRFPEKKISVYVPARDAARGAAYELRAAADWNKTLPLGPLKFAQFPVEVPDGSGGVIRKPASW
jgi:uncharacterized LabA/DUF88 family protein